MAEQTLAEASRLEHPVTHCIALIWTLSVHLWNGDGEATQAKLETFAQVAEVNAFGPYIAATAGFRGKLAVQQGRAGEALGWIEESLARLHAARYELLTTTFEIALTYGLVLNGRYAEALEVVSSTIQRCHGCGELYAMPELLRIRAMVRQAMGAAAEEIEALLHESLAWSGRQGARGCELRTAAELAQLLVEQGRRGEALAVLTPVRSAVSEGFDRADVRAADQLLQTLAADADATELDRPHNAMAGRARL